ncbi:MAG: hypothetical protein CMM38_05960, partial [Rhodospirillaceae bacterium]|nr:hypothetical protein [Rhodospirillaceae bacterium]
MKLSVDHLILRAKRCLKNGNHSEARELYLSILREFPDNKRAQQGLDLIDSTLKLNPTTEQLNSLLSAYTEGRLQDAVTQGTNLRSSFPANINILNILGACYLALGSLDEAIAHYREAIQLKPDYAEAYNNLGVALQNKNNHVEAVRQCKQAIELNSEYAEAYYNLANSLKALDDVPGAIMNYKRALKLKDDYVEAYNNLGIVLKLAGEFNESIKYLNRAISIKPDFSFAHHNLSDTLQDIGDLELSILKDYDALSINPNYRDVWTSIGFTIKSLQISADVDLDSYYEQLRNIDVGNVNYNILQYKLEAFQPHLADKSFDDAVNVLAANSADEITNPQTPDQSSITPSVPYKMIALLHFGRSGTGLLHSLIDNHSEISTLPSIYFSEYFDVDNWKKLIANGWDQIPENFVSQYEVLFDASSSAPVPTINTEAWSLGVDEGMANVGEKGDEVLTVDRDVFCRELRGLMIGYPKLDASTFFTLVHVAFEAALTNPSDKHTILYHIHNPSVPAKLNFLRYRPGTRFIMMVREPLQSCESWLLQSVKGGDYKKICNRIIQMLFDIDQIAFRRCDSVGVRLEDLKLHP